MVKKERDYAAQICKSDKYMAGYRKGMENCELLRFSQFTKEEINAIERGLSVLIESDIELGEKAKDDLLNQCIEERIKLLRALKRKVSTVFFEKDEENC